MRRVAMTLAVLTVLATAPAALAAPGPLSGVIVVLRDGAGDPARIAAEHAGSAEADVFFVYRHALNGYAARMGPAAVRAVAGDPRVAFISPDTPVHASTTQNGATWGLDRSDQRALPLNGSYSYGTTGAGVTAYIIDTGIRTTHTEFGGRASWGTDAVDGTRQDCNGHGTHVSGTVGGTTYGIAKAVSLVAVRVLDCAGNGATSGVIAGIDWATADHGSGPAVANMSLGGGANSALDTAVRNSIADGISYAIAAGNGDILGNPQDACTVSPARVTEAMTIGATQNNDAKASFSNYGSCVDWFAPGVNITSAWGTTSDTGTNTISGTSMATPHVAGAAALYLQALPSASPATVRDALYASTTKSIVTSSNTASNHLLFVEASATLGLSRTAIAFANARTGTTSTAEPVTLTNTGTTAFTVTGVTLAGANPADYVKTADACTGVSLGAGASCQVSAAFSPQATGARTASLQIASGASGSPHTVALTGTGTAPAISVTPSSIAFGDQGTGTTSAARSTTVTNTGTAPLAVGVISRGGSNAADFAVTSDACSNVVLAPAATCGVALTFTPAVAGVRAATLSIPSDAGPAASVTLSGTGVTPTPAISVSPSSIAFGDRPISTTSASRQVTISSVGTAPLQLGTLSITGGAAFAFTANPCSGTTLAVGTSCVAAVAFAPTATGAQAAQVSIPTNAPATPTTVALTGNGVPPAPEVRMSPASLAFPARAVGSTSPAQQVTVTNIGSAGLVVGSLSNSGTAAADFDRTGDTCSAQTIAPGATCVFSVTFRPSTFGTRSASVLFPSNATFGPDRAAVSGTGLAAAAQVTPSALTFEGQVAGSTSAEQSVTVRNIGNAVLSLGTPQASGADATDFMRPTDACSGATLTPNATCVVGVAFAPSAVGARTATLTYPSNAFGAAAVVSLSGTGIGDSTAPVSRWTTRNLDARVGGMMSVTGVVTDDMAGVDRVTVTFTPQVGAPTVVQASIGCSDPLQCGFTALTPLTPGLYRVTAIARDLAGNTESPGAQISLIVV